MRLRLPHTPVRNVGIIQRDSSFPRALRWSSKASSSRLTKHTDFGTSGSVPVNVVTYLSFGTSSGFPVSVVTYLSIVQEADAKGKIW